MENLVVHALGPSGSGKTVLMAGIYSRLRIRRADSAFYVRCDHHTALELNAVQNIVRDPQQDWPKPTGGIRDWRFTLTVPAPAGDFEALSITYKDYPGGLLTSLQVGQAHEAERFLASVRSAHGLLLLLDGVAVFDLMKNAPTSQEYFRRQLAPSLQIAQESRCPIHAVVTKWDLLDGEFTLDEVREKLLGQDEFAAFVAAKQQQMAAIIRLIPVSSVGAGFSEPQSDGTMRKTGQTARPYNIDVPLMALLPDFLKYTREELARQSEQLELQQLRRARWTSDGGAEAASRFRAAITALLNRLGPSLADRLDRRSPAIASAVRDNSALLERAVAGLADKAVDALVERQRVSRSAYQAAFEQQRRAVTTNREALDLVEQQFVDVLADFQSTHPASVMVNSSTVTPGESALGV